VQFLRMFVSIVVSLVWERRSRPKAAPV